MKYVLSAVCLILAAAAEAHEKKSAHKAVGTPCVGHVRILHPFSRATSGANGAAFMMIENTGSKPLSLIEARLAGTHKCDHTELHDHIVTKGPNGQDVFEMRPVETIEIPPKSTTELKPKSKHIMFMSLEQKFTEGQTLSVYLDFGPEGNCIIPVPVLEAGSKGPCTCDHPHTH